MRGRADAGRIPMKGLRGAFLATAGVAAALLAAGILRREFTETLRNAALLCLSCIGIG